MSSRGHDRPGVIPVVALLGCSAAHAADSVGGAVDVTSDYVVRGESRSNHEPAVQASLEFIAAGGLLAGVSGSSVRPDPRGNRGAEFTAFSGYAWQPAQNWRARMVASYYRDVLAGSGRGYDYGEFDVGVSFSDWLDLSAGYSPDYPRYVTYQGLRGFAQESAEAVLHTPWRHHLSASAGAGHAHSGGPAGGGYAYWSLGATLDLAPGSLAVNYLSAGAGAAALVNGPVAHNEWIATLTWRF